MLRHCDNGMKKTATYDHKQTTMVKELACQVYLTGKDHYFLY